MPAHGKPRREAKSGCGEPTGRPEPAPQGDDDGIEILEVVGVDETTGVPTGESEETTTIEEIPVSEDEGEQPAPDQDLKEALSEKERLHDLLLRKQAEFENFRKRSARQSAELRETASAALVERLLPVIDNLERALQSGRRPEDPIWQGVKLIHQQMLDILSQEGLVPVATEGVTFDPQVHEAVEMVNDVTSEPGAILEELQRGYLLKKRLVRPALVKVASGRASETDEPESEAEVREEE